MASRAESTPVTAWKEKKQTLADTQVYVLPENHTESPIPR